MIQKFSYHTHTNFSDGRNSLEEMLEQAVKLGFEKIGISDHFIVHKGFPQSPSLNLLQDYHAPHIYRVDFEKAVKDFKAHYEHIHTVANKYPLKIYVGAEVDYFDYDGWKEGFEYFKSECRPDYCLSGNHFLFLPDGRIIDPRDLSLAGSIKEQKKVVSNHYKMLCKAIASGLFDFIAHIDYMRRVEKNLNEDFRQDKENVVECLAKHNIPTELSTKGLRKENPDYYPAVWLADLLIEKNIPIVISDDAHQISELGSQFDKAESYLQSRNYTNRWKL